MNLLIKYWSVRSLGTVDMLIHDTDLDMLRMHIEVSVAYL